MIQHTQSRLWNAGYTKTWVGNFLIFFSFMLMQPAFPLYLSDVFHADAETIGWVMVGYSITAIIIRLFSGYIVDAYPRRLVLVGSYVLFALCFLGYPLAGSLLAIAVVRTLHGAPFGLTTVSNSTVAVDFLPFSRRAEGIGYYGLSNNLAMATAPAVGLCLYGYFYDFRVLMWGSIAIAALGLLLTISMRFPRPRPKVRKSLSLRNILLWKGWSFGLVVICSAFSYGVVSTYIALYGKEELGITSGTGGFFFLFAAGLILSRLVGSRSLRRGRIIRNGTVGVLLGLLGYTLFAAVSSVWAFYASAFFMGLGNGHMFPALQTMFMNIVSREQRGTANSTLLISWEFGVGIGTLCGGALVYVAGYHAAFWVSGLVNLCGVLLYVLHSRGDFKRKRLC